jgi:hypothetical protein
VGSRGVGHVAVIGSPHNVDMGVQCSSTAGKVARIPVRCTCLLHLGPCGVPSRAMCTGWGHWVCVPVV